MSAHGVGIVGCGLIGRRRAAAANAHPKSACVAVTDSNPAAANELAAREHAEVAPDWRDILDRQDIDIVVVSTPNAYLCPVALAALSAGKHVLIEKPMGRNLEEAEAMARAAEQAGRALKVGFNHRYHPAIAEARRRFVAGEIGNAINVRCRYGHGGRAGYDREWRGSKVLAGGGELTDQGVHVLDLLNWFLGAPRAVYGVLQSAVWPLGELEDNGFGLLEFDHAVASLHTSWTQWKNLFSLELFGERGALVVEGLGRSYGLETLTVHRRRPEGGAPESEVFEYPGDDLSWRDEWCDLLNHVDGHTPMLGTAHDGVAVMRILGALYQSAETGARVCL